MSRAVSRNGLVYATLLHHWLQLLADTPVVDLTKDRFRILFRVVTVTLDDLQGNFQQFYLIGYSRLMTFAGNPFLTVYLNDVVSSQFLQVHERKGGEVHEHEEVTYKEDYYPQTHAPSPSSVLPL